MNKRNQAQPSQQQRKDPWLYPETGDEWAREIDETNRLAAKRQNEINIQSTSRAK